MKKPSLSLMALISIISLVASTSGQILNPIVAVYARDTLNASIAQIGLIVSAFFFVSIISKPLIGLSCRGIKTLYFLWTALALMAFPTIGMALTDSPSIFGVLRIFQGIGNSMFWAPGMTLIALLSSRDKLERNLNNYSFLISIGMSLGPAIGSMSVAALGTRYSFFLSALIMLSGFMIGTLLMRKRQYFREIISHNDSGTISLRQLPRIVSAKPFKTAFLSYVTMSFIYGILTAYGTLYFKDSFRVQDGTVAILFFGYNAVIMVSRFGLRKLVDMTSKTNILVFGLINYVVMLSILSTSNSLPIFVAAFCLLGLSHGLIYPTGILMVAGSVQTASLAFANSIYLTGWDVGNSLGPVIASPIATQYGTRATLPFAIIAPVVSMIITVLYLREQPKNRTDTKAEIREEPSRASSAQTV
jgi:MFS family permease